MKTIVSFALTLTLVSSCSKLLTNVCAEGIDEKKDHEHHHFLVSFEIQYSSAYVHLLCSNTTC